jgi:hypothetical protein
LTSKDDTSWILFEKYPIWFWPSFLCLQIDPGDRCFSIHWFLFSLFWPLLQIIWYPQCMKVCHPNDSSIISIIINIWLGIDLQWNYQKHFWFIYIKELLVQKYWQLISTKQLWSVRNIVSSKSRTVQYRVPRCPNRELRENASRNVLNRKILFSWTFFLRPHDFNFQHKKKLIYQIIFFFLKTNSNF